jgi:hypothetical protein
MRPWRWPAALRSTALRPPLPAPTSLRSLAVPYYDENLFLLVVRTGKVRVRDLSAMIPFVAYRSMRDEDSKAIQAYLRTIPPLHRGVDKFLSPTAGKLGQGKHGEKEN